MRSFYACQSRTCCRSQSRHTPLIIAVCRRQSRRRRSRRLGCCHHGCRRQTHRRRSRRRVGWADWAAVHWDGVRWDGTHPAAGRVSGRWAAGHRPQAVSGRRREADGEAGADGDGAAVPRR